MSPIRATAARRAGPPALGRCYLERRRDSDDLAHPVVPGHLGADVHDQVDARRHGRDDERRSDVLAGQQRQDAHLHHRLAGAVRVQRAHAGQSGVQRDQQDERPGRREAQYRRERNEARARVTELEQRVESLLYRDLARIAGDTLEDGWDFVLFMPRLADVLDDDGIPDPEKIAVRAEQLAEWKPGLRKGARVPTPSFGQAAGRQSTMTAVPPGARCCAGLTEDAPGRPLAGPLGLYVPRTSSQQSRV
jgi:hypothetical protein